MIAALDATYSVGTSLSGVGVYSREILNALAGLRPDDTFLRCYRPHRLWRGLRERRSPNTHAAPLFEAWEPFRCDLFHGLNQRLPAYRFRRTVCTFHDLFVMTSEYSTPEFRSRFTAQAREAAERADLIVCVSEFTAGQVEALLHVECARLRVIHHGTRFIETPERVERQPWILHVGAVQTRKNLLRLIEAFERVAPAPWRLVLAGGDGFGAGEIRDRAAESPARDRIEFPGWVDDHRLEELYARSSLLAFPSLDEGFGIPVLEAMAWGVPVVASNRSSLPEVCGDAALLVDPGDTEALGEAIRSLIDDPVLASTLAARGRERARRRPWSAAAMETLRVYSELLP
ncbi:MAG: glycosyltransferase family 1 protein [Bryobacteraceae bacterium]|nr:glycosyltransferase family 1 protein [Bryobacteraceae bacterium]